MCKWNRGVGLTRRIKEEAIKILFFLYEEELNRLNITKCISDNRTISDFSEAIQNNLKSKII